MFISCTRRHFNTNIMFLQSIYSVFFVKICSLTSTKRLLKKYTFHCKGECILIHTKKQNYIRKIIIVLTALLVLTSTALAGMIIYKYIRANKNVPATVPNNIITEKETTIGNADWHFHKNRISGTLSIAPIVIEEAKGKNVTLKIYRNHAEASTPFYANNLFPGDEANESFEVQVSYKGSVVVHFHADLREGSEKLAEVLKCRITMTDGSLLYEGLIRDMPRSIDYPLPQSDGTTVNIIYDLNVYLDTSVGNEYQNKSLAADFRWWVDETETSESTESTETTESTEDSETTETTESTENSRPSEDDDTSEETSETEKVPSGGGILIDPTGDTMKLLLWSGLAGVSLILIIFLIIVSRNKKEDKTHD